MRGISGGCLKGENAIVTTKYDYRSIRDQELITYKIPSLRYTTFEHVIAEMFVTKMTKPPFL